MFRNVEISDESGVFCLRVLSISEYRNVNASCKGSSCCITGCRFAIGVLVGLLAGVRRLVRAEVFVVVFTVKIELVVHSSRIDSMILKFFIRGSFFLWKLFFVL